MNIRTQIRTASLLAVMALVAAACGGGGGGDEVASQGTSSSTSTTSSTTTTPTADDSGGSDAPGGGGGEAGSGGGGGGGGGESGGTSGGSGGEDGSAPNAPEAAQPAAPGTYEYDTDGQTETGGTLGGTEELPELTTLEVQPADGARQRSVRDMRDDNGDGTVTTTDLLYRDDGVYVEYLKITARDSGVTLTFEFILDPPELVAPTNPSPGFHTEFSTESTNGGIRADVTIDITDRETVTIGGTSVDTVVLVTHIEFEGDIDGESTSTDNIDTDRSLRVREDSVSDIRFGPTTSHTEYVATLRSLSPK